MVFDACRIIRDRLTEAGIPLPPGSKFEVMIRNYIILFTRNRFDDDSTSALKKIKATFNMRKVDKISKRLAIDGHNCKLLPKFCPKNAILLTFILHCPVPCYHYEHLKTRGQTV